VDLLKDLNDPTSPVPQPDDYDLLKDVKTDFIVPVCQDDDKPEEGRDSPSEEHSKIVVNQTYSKTIQIDQVDGTVHEDENK